MGLRSGIVAAVAGLALAWPAGAQGKPATQPAQTSLNLSPLLLPVSFAGWQGTPDAPANGPEPAFSLVNANKEALEECAPQRSAVKNYTSGGKTLHVEAVQFKDATGALAAFSLLDQPGMREVKGLGTRAAEGDGGVLFVEGASVAVAFPASEVDLATLKSLGEVMPQPVGSQGLQPLLPTLAPSRGMLSASMRYALGRETYMADGGVLPAAGLGWEQSAEALTSKYGDRRGTETLTLLMYPTPTIAAAHLRTINNLLPGLGASFRQAKTRREGPLDIVAEGTFSPDAAQALVENTHLRQILSTDKAMVTPEVVETRKTFGLLANIIIFSGFLGVMALGVAIFLGGGRALIRIMQGKPPATEAEFLSLHLDPQNAPPQFSVPGTREGL